MRALILTGKLAQDIEVFYPLYRMQEEGWKVDIACNDDTVVEGVYGMKITPTIDMAGFWISGFDCLILPGGARALEYLRQSLQVINIIKSFYSEGKVIGSICHGAQLLITAGLVRGRKVSGYYSIRDDIINAGGEFVDAPFVNDNRIICSPHYKYLGPWMGEVVREVRFRAK